ncbi:MAG TPA: hypothetical protein VNN79_22430, partial [Actinomycetota bacterium]|nr:hypothetical protein [Actinomycetota bacterium]
YRGQVQEEATGQLTANVFVGALTQNAITIEAPFIGTLLAPRATVNLATVGAPGHRGAFFGKTVEVRPDTKVTHYPFPSTLITDVTVNKTTVCENEPVVVQVRTQSLSGSATDQQPQVTINGQPGAKRNLQFLGTGDRTVFVAAFQGGVAERRKITIHIVSCAQALPRVVVAPTLRPYEVELTVTNADAFTGTGLHYVWTFGDGQTADTQFPSVVHSYEGALDARRGFLEFEATVTVKRTGVSDAAVKKTVAIPNLYAQMASRGFVRPPITNSDRLARVDKALQGQVSIRNVETAAIQLTAKQIERHFCDPDLNPTLDPATTIAVSVAAGQTFTEQVRLEAAQFGSNVCGVSVHYTGRTADNLVVRASAHFETPARSLFETPVTSAELKTLLNQVTSGGMTADPNRVTFEELRRLKLQNRISAVPATGDVVFNALDSSGEVIGHVCDPEETPPVPGVTCATTDEWTITPPLVRNAQKGDLMIVAACETVGKLLRKVSPRQVYSHEGIMTRNYFALAESTFAEGRALITIEGIGDIINEDKLKFGWPGAIRGSINEVFGDHPVVDPEGRLQLLHTFRPEPVQCADDATPSPPLVIRPPIGSDAAIRPSLRAAADFAKTVETHYRFFGFSQGNIAFDGANNFSGGNFRSPSGEPPTVSTSFLWFSLKSSGVTLEGTVGENYFRPNPISGNLNEVDDGAQPPRSAGITDGLYLYTASERRAGADFIFSDTHDRVSELQNAKVVPTFGTVVGPMVVEVADFIAQQADEIAAQFTNCFGSDKCGADGARKLIDDPGHPGQKISVVNHDFENVGEGTAVSPDNFLFWDTTAYGDWEPVHYVSGEARRVSRWAAAADTSSISGTVRLEDGTLVADALVTAAGQETATAADGTYSFPAVPATAAPGIRYEVRGRK